MTATLQQFSRALLTPRASFKTLLNAIPATTDNGLPRLRRSTRFVEAEIEQRSGYWLVALPLTPAALLRIEPLISALKRLNSEFLTTFYILPDEMRWTDEYTGAEHHADLVLQRLPSMVTFAEAVLTQKKETLLAALDALQTELQRLQFTHNNLIAENLRWCNGRFVPIRYYDARIGEASDADAAAFEALRAEITAAKPVEQPVVCDVEAPYHPASRLTGHLWVSNTFEGLICVEDDCGYGFVDAENNPVIAPQFMWAGDFHEGRAEVQTPAGMGLIDREGTFIIPAEYEIIDYDYARSVVHVRKNGKWALFDYLGRPLTDFAKERAEVR